MAALVTFGDGLRRIEFAPAPNARRKLIRLGRVTKKYAQTALGFIERIIADRALDRPHDADTAAWLRKLDESVLARLRRVGLADGVGLSRTTLGAFLERYFETIAVKGSTRTFYSHTRRNLETHFGKGRALRSITTSDADAWRTSLIETEKLSPATVARRVGAARTIWRKAIRWNLAAENPFEGIKAGHQVNESRKRYISREIIADVLNAAPDAEWRAIIALARYAGLRTPSETFALRWGDIDWDRGTVRVTCPKLAHHEKFASRTIPLFAELRKPLLELFDDAEPGCEYVIARHRLGSANLRTQFERIIARAGHDTWPRLFHNLRASRESELMREYDLATVCKWLGNSPAIAAQHYATSVDLDSDFRRAAGLDAIEAQQKAQQPLTSDAVPAMTDVDRTINETPENAEFVTASQSQENPGKTGSWAILDSNQ